MPSSLRRVARPVGSCPPAAAALALTLIEIDAALGPAWIERVAWLDAGTPAGIRSVVSVIAGSMITVTGVVFSITVVALTLASSQFGPRLLRSFLRDRGTQVSLGAFIATFLYSLLVLRAVDDARGVPHLSATGAVALATASLFVLIYFIHHVASSIQALHGRSAAASIRSAATAATMPTWWKPL